jgi:hypothetical protein
MPYLQVNSGWYNQVLSCFSRFTRQFRTVMEWIERELFLLFTQFIKHLASELPCLLVIRWVTLSLLLVGKWKTRKFIKLITAGHSGPHSGDSEWHSSIYISIRLSCSIVSESSHKGLAVLWQRVLSPTQCIVSISVRYVCFICCTQDLTLLHKVGRMMMNIRGLIMDDPEHTVHLQTLDFADRHCSGSEIEERGWG